MDSLAENSWKNLMFRILEDQRSVEYYKSLKPKDTISEKMTDETAPNT